jgi:hypothetical protein
MLAGSGFDGEDGVTMVVQDPAMAGYGDIPVLLHRVGELMVLGQARNDAQFARIDARFAAVDARFDAVDARFDAVEARLDRVELAMQRGFDRIDARFEQLVALIIHRETGEPVEGATPP